MTENIVLNPTDHPVGTEFIHATNSQMISDVVTRWSEGGRLQIKSRGSRYWFYPAEVEVLEVLPAQEKGGKQ